jgi:hypothetical protein
MNDIVPIRESLDFLHFVIVLSSFSLWSVLSSKSVAACGSQNINCPGVKYDTMQMIMT